MDEETWFAYTDIEDLLHYMPPDPSERKLRLFGCALIRPFWPLLTDTRSRTAVEVAERFADGQARKADMATARKVLQTKDRDRSCKSLQCAYRKAGRTKEEVKKGVSMWECAWNASRATTLHPLTMTAVWNASIAVSVIPMGLTETGAVERLTVELASQTSLLRDMLGGWPFRSVRLEPAWQTSTIRNLALAAYEERQLPSGILDPERLAVLGDALEEVGCQDPAILESLRSALPRWRGYHIVDTLLGKW